MRSLSKAFSWFADLSSKLPKIDFKAFFWVVIVAILAVGAIMLLTMLFSPARKLRKACKRVIKYLAGVESIDEDNVGDFTSACFTSKSTPYALRDTWVQYLGIRFGYPSDIVSEKEVFDKLVKRVRDIRPNIFILISLALVAIFAFWGFGTLSSADMSVIHCAGLLLSAILYFVLVVLSHKQFNKTLEVFNTMQEDLDAKVDLAVERNYALDSSPLVELAAILDEIIARNTSKDVEMPSDEPTPIEELIAAADGARAEESEGEEPEEEPVVHDEELTSEDEPFEEEPPEEVEDIPEKEVAEESEDTLPAWEVEDEEPEEELEEETPEETPEEELEEAPFEEEESVEEEGEEPVAPQEDEAEQPVEEETIEEASEESAEENEIAEEEAPAEEAPLEEAPSEETPAEEAEEEPPVEEESVEEEAPAEETSETSEEEVAQQSEAQQEEPEEAPEQPEEELPEETPAHPEQEEVEEGTEEKQEPEQEPDQEDEQPEASEEEVPEEESSPEEPEVVYHVENVDLDEDAKPAKLVKLPSLVDYMLSMNLPDSFKGKFVTLLTKAYQKFMDSPEDRQIIVDCLKKISASMSGV